MNVFDEYRALYDSSISANAKLTIVQYDAVKKTYEYRPYSHFATADAIDRLSNLIIDNMVFYAFSEEEVVNTHKRNGMLDDLKAAAKYAYIERLPKRINAATDGTTGEVLLDILIQVYEPVNHKLIARAKFKQMGDNSEIKGYDALYFAEHKNEVSLWLGQVKTGSCEYCKSSISTDLNAKYVLDYFSRALYYIADKVETNNPLLKILHKVNDIHFESLKKSWTQEQKRKKLFELLSSFGVRIKIPCVLVYTDDIYSNPNRLRGEIVKATNAMVDFFDNKVFTISIGLAYEVIYYVFPVRNVQELREKVLAFKMGK